MKQKKNKEIESERERERGRGGCQIKVISTQEKQSTPAVNIYKAIKNPPFVNPSKD